MRLNPGYLYLIPTFLLLISVSFYPLLRTFQLSFTRYDLTLGMKEPQYVGLTNYLNLLSDEGFLVSLRTTLLFTGATVAVECAVGLLMALTLNERFRARGAMRTLLIIPWGIPAVVEGQMWKFLFNDQIGAVNALLQQLGLLEEYVAWLADPTTAMVALITAEAWATSIFIGLILLGGLQSIPEDLYEAAKMDGAGRFRRFLHITLPLLKPAFVVALVFRTTQAFSAFDVIYVMTGGGPGGSTRVLSVYAYDTYFNYLKFGYGSTIAVAHFALSLVMALLYLKLMRVRLG